MPWLFKRSTIKSIAWPLPERTMLCGALTAAIETDGNSAIAALAETSSVTTLTIFPPMGRDCIKRPRAATIRTASSSVNTFATHAAAYSPILCPKTKSGTMPHSSKSFASEYSIANRAGCVYSVWFKASLFHIISRR